MTPEDPGDEPRNCKESPYPTPGLCSKESSNCSLGVNWAEKRQTTSENLVSEKTMCATQLSQS